MPIAQVMNREAGAPPPRDPEIGRPVVAVNVDSRPPPPPRPAPPGREVAQQQAAPGSRVASMPSIDTRKYEAQVTDLISRLNDANARASGAEQQAAQALENSQNAVRALEQLDEVADKRIAQLEAGVSKLMAQVTDMASRVPAKRTPLLTLLRPKAPPSVNGIEDADYEG